MSKEKRKRELERRKLRRFFFWNFYCVKREERKGEGKNVKDSYFGADSFCWGSFMI